MKLEIVKPKTVEYRIMRVGVNQWGRRYIEAVEIRETHEQVLVEKRSWLETAYLYSVTLIGCWVGWTFMQSTI